MKNCHMNYRSKPDFIIGHVTDVIQYALEIYASKGETEAKNLGHKLSN